MSSELSPGHSFFKRAFDIFFSLLGLLLFGWLILIAYIIACIDTRGNGFFVQDRVGRDGELFKVVKIKTMRSNTNVDTNVTKSSDPRITQLGAFFRKTKIDELPQLYNVLIGNMSFVGPRPDVPGFADKLEGKERKILSVRPGITGPATLAYRNEEEILEEKEDPEKYNEEIIYPRKVKINLKYIDNYSFLRDLKFILATICPKLTSKIDKKYLNVEG